MTLTDPFTEAPDTDEPSAPVTTAPASNSPFSSRPASNDPASAAPSDAAMAMPFVASHTAAKEAEVPFVTPAVTAPFRGDAAERD